jgi:hypothetical protein
MICLEGTGCLSHVSLRHQPEILNEPHTFAAICVKGKDNVARVLEGPVPGYKIMFPFGGQSSGNGGGGRTHGLPRMHDAKFVARFPFGTVSLADPLVPLAVELTGWSPFTPPEPDDSSLPVAALEYRFTNTTGAPVEAVFSFHSANFMKVGGRGQSDAKGAAATGVYPIDGGFELRQAPSEKEPWTAGALRVVCNNPAAVTDCAWFRGGWFDPLTMIWKAVSSGKMINRGAHTEGAPSKGASLYVPLRLKPRESKTVRLMLAWYVPCSNVKAGNAPFPDDWCDEGCCAGEACSKSYVPWYASRFENVDEVATY